MTTPFTAAAAAYGSAAKLISQGTAPAPAKVGGDGQSADFASLLAETVQGVVESGKVADEKTLDLVNGKGDIVDVVTAISQTEIAMETMVTVRDRVISAYEEIMRMPI